MRCAFECVGAADDAEALGELADVKPRPSSVGCVSGMPVMVLEELAEV